MGISRLDSYAGVTPRGKIDSLVGNSERPEMVPPTFQPYRMAGVQGPRAKALGPTHLCITGRDLQRGRPVNRRGKLNRPSAFGLCRCRPCSLEEGRKRPSPSLLALVEIAQNRRRQHPGFLRQRLRTISSRNRPDRRHNDGARLLRPGRAVNLELTMLLQASPNRDGTGD